jgi:hypothetical protein
MPVKDISARARFIDQAQLDRGLPKFLEQFIKGVSGFVAWLSMTQRPPQSDAKI